ncbi:MAG: adenosine kinase [Candidatus Kapabacteria bacterium]|nr:adenosine kinase [Candidatus Kapabacteria bacterium]
MKHLLLTGIGNALVDIEYRVTDAELVSLELTKGAMMLTDAERQHAMIAGLGERDAHRSSGGSAANTVIAFAQFGGRASYCSLLGKDAMGAFYASEFNDLGIVLDAEQVAGATTGTCLVLITPDSERTLNTTLAVNTEFTRRNIDEERIKASEWIYIEGYKLTDDNGAEAVDMAMFYAKKHDTNVAISCSDGFIVDVFGDRLRPLLDRAQLVFCNEREATTLARVEHGQEAYRALASAYPNVVVTMGAHGSRIGWNGHHCDVPAYAVEAVDATGAGDMFAGAFMYGVLHRHHPEHAGRLASYASAQVVAQYGARLKASHIEVRDTILRSAETLP